MSLFTQKDTLFLFEDTLFHFEKSMSLFEYCAHLAKRDFCVSKRVHVSFLGDMSLFANSKRDMSEK